VPAAVALYEFVLKGRKRLGYRVQMDTTATDVVPSPFAGALRHLQDNGVRLDDPTLALLRIENNGATDIDTHDYAVLDDDLVGIRISFPGRRVAGLVVTELSDDFLRSCFAEGSGLGVRDGVIELPKVPLNRHAHYKVLAALERAPGEPGKPGQYPDPEVVGGIKGGVGGGRILQTRSRTGTSWRSVGLVGFLVAVVLAQLTVTLSTDPAAPLDCARGRLAIIGSTAFEPVVREAADRYRDSCPKVTFSFDMRGSGEGLRGAGPDTIVFSDGEKPEGYPKLLPRAIAFFLFSLAIGGHRATLEDADHGAYPFWETEYAYTYGEPAAGSPAASFLRYLTNQVGADVIRSYGNRPCAELDNPALCRPVPRP
jgi:phosphate transport system substrate-binding protein